MNQRTFKMSSLVFSLFSITFTKMYFDKQNVHFELVFCPWIHNISNKIQTIMVARWKLAREFRLYNGLWYFDGSIISLRTLLRKNGRQCVHACIHAVWFLICVHFPHTMDLKWIFDNGPVRISKSIYSLNSRARWKPITRQ